MWAEPAPAAVLDSRYIQAWCSRCLTVSADPNPIDLPMRTRPQQVPYTWPSEGRRKPGTQSILARPSGRKQNRGSTEAVQLSPILPSTKRAGCDVVMSWSTSCCFHSYRNALMIIMFAAWRAGISPARTPKINPAAIAASTPASGNVYAIFMKPAAPNPSTNT
jgi:hypothetical protein